MANNTTINFTKTSLQNIPLPLPNKRAYYKDTQLKGLVLAVQPSGAKTFYVYKKIQGRPERIRLGGFPDLSVDQARKQGQIMLGQIAEGHNPQDEKRRLR